MSNNRICAVCGEKYEYCPSCNKDFPLWKSMFHDETCNIVFNTVGCYIQKIITKEQALKELESCNFYRFDYYSDNIKNALLELYPNGVNNNANTVKNDTSNVVDTDTKNSEKIEEKSEVNKSSNANNYNKKAIKFSKKK